MQGQSTRSIDDIKDCSVIDEGKYAIFFDITEEEAEGYIVNNSNLKLPVLVLYFVEGHLIRHKYPPRIYTAIWEDGTIVWGACQDTKIIVSDIEDIKLEIKYFYSKIDVDDVKQLLDILVKSSVWDGENPIILGASCTHLRVRSGEKKYETSGHATSVLTPSMIISVLLTENRGMVKGAWQWEQAVKKILDVVPIEGDPVNILFEKHSAFGWSGVVRLSAEPKMENETAKSEEK